MRKYAIIGLFILTLGLVGCEGKSNDSKTNTSKKNATDVNITSEKKETKKSLTLKTVENSFWIGENSKHSMTTLFNFKKEYIRYIDVNNPFPVYNDKIAHYEELNNKVILKSNHKDYDESFTSELVLSLNEDNSVNLNITSKDDNTGESFTNQYTLKSATIEDITSEFTKSNPDNPDTKSILNYFKGDSDSVNYGSNENNISNEQPDEEDVDNVIDNNSNKELSREEVFRIGMDYFKNKGAQLNENHFSALDYVFNEKEGYIIDGYESNACMSELYATGVIFIDKFTGEISVVQPSAVDTGEYGRGD